MTPFSGLALSAQLLLCGLLFFAAMSRLALCIYRYVSTGSWRRCLGDGLLFLAVLLPLALFTASADPARGFFLRVPWGLLPLLSALLTAGAAAGMAGEYRRSRQSPSPAMIRETLDDLNTGICFSDATGRMILVNRTMGELAAALTGSYPQTLAELTGALGSPGADRGVTVMEGDPLLYRFPDDRVWQFRTAGLTDPALSGFTQVTAQDVTQLWEVNERLREGNEALAGTNEKLKRMYERLADRIREEETLSLKMRVHNEIGASLIALSELLENGSAEDMDRRLLTLQDAVRYFSGSGPAMAGTLEGLRRQAGEMGVTLALEGALPSAPWMEELITDAARECVTNCVRHAGGDRVTVAATRRTGVRTVVITNSGRVPQGPIAEGGGLSALRKKVEARGGEMRLSHAPRFALILNLPEQEVEL